MPYRLRFQNLKNVLHRNATAEVSGYNKCVKLESKPALHYHRFFDHSGNCA